MKINRNLFRKFSAWTGLFLLCFIFKGEAQNVTNYTFSATAGTFTQIQGTGGSVSPALSGGTLDDGWFNSVPIGFPFTFEGVSYTTLSASTNGWFLFGGTISSAAWTNNLATGTPRPIVAPLWDDLALSATGNFTYYLSGTYPSRVLTVEWLNAKWNYASGAAGISFQVKLYESNKRIEFVYRQDAGAMNIPSASIGIAGITSGTFLSLNGTGVAPTASSITETTTLNAKPATGQTYDFDRYTANPTITSVTPMYGILGTTVTITGSNFDAQTSNDIVYFGSTKATVLTATTTVLTVSVPIDAIYAPISVTTNAGFLTAWTAKPYDVTFPCSGYSLVNNPSFGGETTFASGNFPTGVAVGDIDGDGKSDLVVTNQNNNSISVYRNTSTYGTLNSSSFAAKVDFSTGLYPYGVAIGDLDGDGKLDIVVTNDGVAFLTVFRNTSVSGVINSSSLSTGTNLNAANQFGDEVWIADIDQDGKADLLSGCTVPGYGFNIYRNISTPGILNSTSFAAATHFGSSGPVSDITAGDLDNDGKPDVVICQSNTTNLEVLRNLSIPGTISLASSTGLGVLSHSSIARIADFDGDGKSDIAVSGSNIYSGLEVFQNYSTPGIMSFSSRLDYPCPSITNEMCIADVNGDNKPEVLLDNGGGNVFVYPNGMSPGPMDTYSFQSYTTCWFSSSALFGLASGDLDSDGKPEIITTDQTLNSISIMHNLFSQYTAIAPATVTGATSYCYDGQWKTFFDPADQTKVLFAIKENGNNLGTITANEYEDGAPGNYNGIRFLARHFKITPTTQPSSAVQIRLYFTNAELTALQGVDPSIVSAANLSVTKYDGPTEDGIYSPGDATSLNWYPQGSMTNSTAYGGAYLEFTINSFSDFWIHG